MSECDNQTYGVKEDGVAGTCELLDCTSRQPKSRHVSLVFVWCFFDVCVYSHFVFCFESFFFVCVFFCLLFSFALFFVVLLMLL